jgi:hypothetical protein
MPDVVPASMDDSSEVRREPPPWEPEPLHLPLEVPRSPERRDDAPTTESESRVIVIDLA